MDPGANKRDNWIKIGYGLTGLWIMIILLLTGNNPSHPLFNFIFIVPIAGWGVAILVVRVLLRKK